MELKEKLQNAGILSRGNQLEALKKECEELRDKLSISQAEVKAQQESASAATAEFDGCRAEITALAEFPTSRSDNAKLLSNLASHLAAKCLVVLIENLHNSFCLVRWEYAYVYLGDR